MNTYPFPMYMRSYLSNIFTTLRMQAVKETLWAKLFRRHTKLAIFPEQTSERQVNRRLIDTDDILVEHIVGTLNRQNDFDHKFRPLKGHLKDRWVNTYLSLERDVWSPILVHKVGEKYYVEDGHHRVSVARSLGMVYIPAKVWDYAIPENKSKKCRSVPCSELCSATVYATG